MGFYFHPYSLNQATKSISCTLSNTTGSISIWSVVGRIAIIHLYGIVTTAISTTHTSGGWRMISASGTSNITTLGGILSSGPIDSIIYKSGPAITTAPIVALSTVSSVQLCNLAGTTGLAMGPIAGATSMIIEYRYTTTDSPSSGVLEMHLWWYPLEPGSTVTAV